MLHPYAVVRLGINPLLKIICGIREVLFDYPTELAEDLCDVSETTESIFLHEFWRATVKCFEGKYIRESTPGNLEKIKRKFAYVKVPRLYWLSGFKKLDLE